MAAEQPKIGDVLKAQKADETYVSFEFFPPRTEKGEEALMTQHLPALARQRPVFIDFTWGAGGTTSEKTPQLCLAAQERFGLTVNMHITCTNMPEGKVKEALDLCRERGIRNIVALRGDPPAGQEWKASKEGFACALDLVRYTRANYGDYFSIIVAGYPEGHPDRIDAATGRISAEGMAEELAYLKAKVDAGADAIITQLFYDPALFIDFVRAARAAGIDVPILPGLLPMVSYAGLKRMVGLCKTYLPPAVAARVEELKDDEEGFKAYGVEQTTQAVRDILAADIGVRHFHFYTLNVAHSTLKVLENVGLLRE